MSINSVNLANQKNNIKLRSKSLDKETPKDKEKSGDELNAVEQTLVNSVAPARRILGLPDMIKEGDGIAAAGLAALTIVSLPEDCRDLKDAYKHSASFLTNKKYKGPYDFNKYQHDFSFFRGTLLHEGMKKVKSERGKRIVEKLYNADKTLYNTQFGQWVKDSLGIEDGKKVHSKIKNLQGKEIPVQEIIVKKDFLGLKDLTARAMKRTTVLGLGFMGALELPKIIKSLDKKEDRSKAFAEQSAKSTMNVLGLNIGMGYLGAIGGKKFGSVGSLLGMGAGVLAGAGASKCLQDKIFKPDQQKNN